MYDYLRGLSLRCRSVTCRPATRARAHLLRAALISFALSLAACGGGGGGSPPGDLNFPDLVPAQNPSIPGIYYDYDGPAGEVLVWVENQGSLTAPSSYVSITFKGSGGSIIGTVEIATPTGPMAPGDVVGPLRAIVLDPGACFSPGCSFTITVDSRDDVEESREDNNQQDDAILG